MGTFLLRLVDAEEREWWLEWSTVVDAPVSQGMTEGELRRYISASQGPQGMMCLPDRMERARESGSSGFPPYHRLEHVISGNRAGKGETHLPIEGILREYCPRSLAPAAVVVPWEFLAKLRLYVVERAVRAVDGGRTAANPFLADIDQIDKILNAHRGDHPRPDDEGAL